jgi:hypothetical protein
MAPRAKVPSPHRHGFPLRTSSIAPPHLGWCLSSHVVTVEKANAFLHRRSCCSHSLLLPQFLPALRLCSARAATLTMTADQPHCQVALTQAAKMLLPPSIPFLKQGHSSGAPHEPSTAAFFHCDDLIGAGLLWPFPGPEEPFPSITESQGSSTSTSAPISTVPPAAHQRAPSV